MIGNKNEARDVSFYIIAANNVEKQSSADSQRTMICHSTIYYRRSTHGEEEEIVYARDGMSCI